MSTQTSNFQFAQDALVWNAVAPSYIMPLPGAEAWGDVTFAEYVLTLGGPGDFLITNNETAFLNTIYQNALGRNPGNAELSFYEAVISSHPVNAEGYALALLYIASSPESQEHNHLILGVGPTHHWGLGA